VVDEDLARFRSLIVVCLAALLSLACDGGAHEVARRDRLPPVVLWAWERPENLSFVDQRDVGVAFLAETISITPQAARSSGDLQQSLIVRPRLQPLRIPSATTLVAVVRIEAPGTVARSTAPHVARHVAQLPMLPGVRAIQIDFDARASQRAFYRDLLQDLRGRLPNTMALSITALASWCLGDRWLADLPAGTIDEAVPMLFRMGPEKAAVTAFVRSGREFAVPVCRNSIGLSTDEPLSGLPPGKRLYLFHPRPWDPRSAAALLVRDTTRRAD
jgi:hypothetical protein